MGRLLPVFLMRIATLLVASLLLSAVFGKAKAQDDNYGLKRFSGDNYDTISAPVRHPSAPITAAPMPAAAAPYTPAPSATPYGYKPLAPAQPAYPAPRATTAAPP